MISKFVSGHPARTRFPEFQKSWLLDYDKVKFVFNEVKKKGFLMNINGLVNLMFMEYAEQVFEVMETGVVKPDIVNFDMMFKGYSLMYSYAKRGHIDEVIRLFENGLLRETGRLDEAQKLFEEMVNNGCSCEFYCYNALIDALVKNDKIDDCNRMENEGSDQTVCTYTIIMNGSFKKHRNDEALKICDSMIDKGITPIPASFHFSTGV
ncbi:pentatricopeptide repeat-containing protein At3g09040, mitochondrial-like [Rutidosis leptorrhynchoides]|uniref:pentatricopeptide repeat-containing protein At3g09040, mitochondrial-like n=1 Tax=Rutidosis leptorrhynchoides TaxID=125765 RepID=UPI003A9942FC